MSIPSLLGFRRKHAPDRRAAESKPAPGNGHSADAQQPFSDGSEEFFEEFTRREESSRRHEQTGFLVALALILGLFLGLSAVAFLRQDKARPSKLWRWLGW